MRKRHIVFAVLSLAVALSAPVWGQGEATPADCAAAEICVDGVRWGAWGMIGLGLLFLAVGVIPPPRRREDEVGNAGGLSLLRVLQARIEKETTGWRRWQWPVLGLFFIGLGAATLFGWR
jgi:hypothetical protein